MDATKLIGTTSWFFIPISTYIRTTQTCSMNFRAKYTDTLNMIITVAIRPPDQDMKKASSYAY
jgi:hypothetical protein